MRAEIIIYDDKGETVKIFSVYSNSVVMLKKAISNLMFKDFFGENAQKLKQWKADNQIEAK